MIWGFTGTSSGVTLAQLNSMRYWLERELQEPGFFELHHGDCIEADAAMHALVMDVLGEAEAGNHIVRHPCTIESKRAFCEGGAERLVKPPLDRNRDIVLESDALLAVPAEFHEVVRSGTWATVRYAVAALIPVTIIWPDGLIQPDWSRQR